MTQFENDVRLFVYQHFVSNMRAPTVLEVSEALGTSSKRSGEAFEALAAQHVLVLHPDTREIWMAMPFSALPTPHQVRIGDSTWWANCAWDALGVPAMTDSNALITTRCPATAEILELKISSGRPEPAGLAFVHFAVPAARWWDDVGYT